MPQSKTERALRDRVDLHGARLLRQVRRIYGDDVAQPLYDRALAILKRSAGHRHPDLQRQDEARLRNPDWFVAPDMVGYSTYVDRFADTLAGVTDRVSYLESIGVRYLHLLSVLKAREGDSDGGFAVSDYGAVEPRLGTDDDLDRLVERLRAARISLCVDLALNHTADDHDWARAARAGDPHYRDFYIVLDPDEAARREHDLKQVFPATAPGNFTRVPEMGGAVWTTFYPFQWDLNWANPDVFLAILEAMLGLANRGVEAFRLDSIAFLWKQAGTDCRNLPEAHYIVRALRAALDIAAPGTLLKAEAIVPTAFVAPYFGVDEGEGFEPECQIVYNNSLMVAGWVALAEESADLPRAILEASGGLPFGANWLTYSRCHDDIGWGNVLADLQGLDPDPLARLTAAARFLEGADGSWARGEPFQTDGGALHGTNGTLASLAGLEAADDPDAREAAYRRIALLGGLAIATGGLACTYMGDECGMLNDRSYTSDPDKAHEGRWLHRPAMDWRCVDGARALRISGDLRALQAARIASGGAGSPEPVDTGRAAVLGLVCGSDRVYLNFSGHAATIDPAVGRDRLSGRSVDGETRLDPWQILWVAPA